jgi:para-aminobenzoate synthetase
MTGWSWFESQLEIMSFKHENRPIYGVQFHPEAICTNNGLAIINNFRGLLHA